MNKTQAIIALALAMAIGYAAGYFSHLIRFPFRPLAHSPSQTAASTSGPVKRGHPLAAQIEQARKLQQERKTAEAQKLLREQIRTYPQAPDIQAARELLGAINTELFFSNKNLYGKTEYVVQRGDTLARIARKLNSSPEMIMRANNLGSTLIRPGDRLVVPDDDFTLTIDLQNERVIVHHGDGFFKQYPIQSIELPPSSQLRVATKVSATTFWKDGERISARAAHLGEATPWVHLARPGYILYGVSEAGEVEAATVEVTEQADASAPEADAVPAENADVPPRGVALLKDDLAELILLLRRGTPVTIIREKRQES